MYNPILAEKQQIVVANKTDILTDEKMYEDFCTEIENRGYKLFRISAATKSGVNELMLYVSSILDSIPVPVLYDENEEEETVITFEEEAPFTVRRDNEAYVVEGEWLKRLINSTNFEDNESLQYFQNSLRKKGVIRALVEKGAGEGDLIRIYELEFEYVE